MKSLRNQTLKQWLFGLLIFAPTVFGQHWQATHLINAEKDLLSGNAAQAAYDLQTRHTFDWKGHAARAERDAQMAAHAEANGNMARYYREMGAAERQLQQAENVHPERFSTADFFQ